GSNNVYEIWFMIGFGVLGYLMNKYNFSPAGVLLGLILGPIAEDGLRDLLIVSDNSPLSFIFTRPIAVVILLCIVLALYFSFKPQPWSKKSDAPDAAPGD
ncbi:MAG: hypothetical protein OER92_08330, partial [Alphaproteobacteria bacterium]|nr:hypothetical protein [Alphaproteobacteria bacterium]